MMRHLGRRLSETIRFRPKRAPIGLDIGSSALKVVQLAPAGQGLRVAAFATELLPRGAVTASGVIDGEAVSAAIRRLLEREQLGCPAIAAALPGQSAVIKRITLPAMTARELDEAIGWEAEQHIPFPLSDVHLHYEPLGRPGPDAPTMDVLLVAARRDSVAALKSVIAGASRTACVIDVGALALQNAYAANRGGGRGSTVALLDVGASATTIAIVVDRQPAFVRHVAFGGQACTEALHEALCVPLETAEQLKKRGSDEGADLAVLDGVVQASTETLVEEIRKTLDFFRATTGAAAIERLFVSGGGSLLAGLLDQLRQRLEIRTIAFDPFRLLGGPPFAGVADSGRHRRMAAVAVGLALRREDSR
jgi:type IV pilus assembly protein PilM